ncbi:hypothetical protein [Prauserella cavernicola]|uniref:Uncharacterized protein n=1 Tax=Prauserella cavernicola TaxID=2800127 RepID=A0A934V5L7_9PSEU|nr:hypothetical protein [Prauserella cavernicola]MBK1786642.1 hypothetical protein [Prauserella cavernicola]
MDLSVTLGSRRFKGVDTCLDRRDWSSIGERTVVSDPPYEPTGAQPAPQNPQKRRHIFRWFFLVVQILFLVWIIAGVANTEDCSGLVGQDLDACEAGTAVGTGIGVGLIIALWAAVDVILGITWLVFRKR